VGQILEADGTGDTWDQISICQRQNWKIEI
jgi:hypothetical protein